MIKYRTRLNAIEMLHVDKETDKTVTVRHSSKGRAYRENKRSDWSNWHDSWEEAKVFLVDEALKKVASAEKAVQYEKEKLAAAEALKPLTGRPINEP
jgi:hypothetical protein